MTPSPVATAAVSAVFRPAVSELGLTRARVEHTLGYRHSPAPGIVSASLDALLGDLEGRTDIACGFTLYPKRDVHVDRHGIRIAGTLISTGSIITARFKRAQAIAAFIVTVGPRFQHWLDELAGIDDPMHHVLADAIGSELAELTADFVHQRIGDTAARDGLRMTNRYSPGYCNWHVSDQHVLFTMLPDGACGVTLNAGALMWPVKSVRGIVGIGGAVEMEEYDCSICSKEECLRRDHA
ncbi:MAG: hypothetical protein IPP94_00405 [Ignavibacteria bacterium]|nr:hypothetical protein [Ignavibacteria bacterium]